MTTRCYYIETIDPYFNLATEEYLLKNSTDDIFMLWRGESSIVVGKHQNALAEINHAYVEEQSLKVARRLSGGGTVFHDPGNINFTFIRNIAQIDKLNYALFLNDVKKVLAQLGLPIYNSERDDLMLDGFKISGNAQHVHKNRVLHHGTLLFDSKLSRLKNALKVDLSRFEHKAVQSNRSEVANIRPYLQNDMEVGDFFDYLFSAIANLMPQHEVSSLSAEEITDIYSLQEEKYSKWDWIYGYSPKYIYRNSNAQGISVYLQVQRGCLSEVQWQGLPFLLQERINAAMLGCRHERKEIEMVLAHLEEDLKLAHLELATLLRLIF